MYVYVYAVSECPREKKKEIVNVLGKKKDLGRNF